MRAVKDRLRARAFLLVGALLTAGIVSAGATGAGSKLSPQSAPNLTGVSTVQFTKDVSRAARVAPTKNGLTSALVKLDLQSVASYTGGVPGYAATAPSKTGKPLELGSPGAVRYRAFVNSKIDAFADAAAALIPGSQVLNRYDVVLGGASMLVPVEGVATLRSMKTVKAVLQDQLVQPDTDNSPSFIGATSFWVNGGVHRGQGVIVGIVDTGIWPEHPSFSDPDPNGIGYPAPHATRSGSRSCQFSGGANPGPAFACNNKLIAAARYMATYDALIGIGPGEYSSVRDSEGHGSHTASTSAGNNNVSSQVFGIYRGQVSGIAPRSHVMAYKGLGVQGGFSSDLAAAIQRAITDGADVINYSVSGGNNPYADAASLAFLDAYNAGVFVAASAGNSGPGADTVAHREPWTTTVAASTQNRAFVTTLGLAASNGDGFQVEGTTIAPPRSPAPVVSAADAPYNDPLCQNSTADGAYSGKIVFCARGTIGRIQKGFNVQRRGGIGMILYNTGLTTDVETDNHFLPAVHIQPAPGTAALAFYHSHTGVVAAWNTGHAAPAQGDVMAAFSSRGGPGQVLGISKPDVTAPGVQILAATSPTPDSVDAGAPGQLFQAIAGTSMSAPHVAGAGALLKEMHPGWTPGQIKSALMTTAITEVIKEDFSTHADPFDDGSGRIDLTKAGNPGLTFDAPGADYITYQSQLFRANYPSLYLPAAAMPGIVTVQRTVTSVLPTTATWTLSANAQKGMKVTVSPESLTLPPGGSATFSITVDASGLPVGTIRFALLRLTMAGNRAFFPIAIVRGQGPVTLNKDCTPRSILRTSSTHCTITATNTADQPANVTITDQLPPQLGILGGTLTGADLDGNGLRFQGTLPPTSPPNITVTPGTTPGGGYLPLSLFGVPPIANPGDDAIFNFNTPPFFYGGEVYTRVGISTNGYVVIGGGTGPDNSLDNQQFPNPARPNNVIAPFWTDLNPGAAGAIRIATLTDGADTWIVVDWENVREFSNGAKTHSMDIWLGVQGDANSVEDNTYAFGNNVGNGDGGFASEGAENKFGNRGTTIYYNGTGVLPANGRQYRVNGSAPIAAAPKVITFDAVGQLVGAWQNCAYMTANIMFGTAASCVTGDVHNP